MIPFSSREFIKINFKPKTGGLNLHFYCKFSNRDISGAAHRNLCSNLSNNEVSGAAHRNIKTIAKGFMFPIVICVFHNCVSLGRQNQH